MAFRFDMQGKTSQQQVIVAKRDAEDKRIKEEQEKNQLQKKKKILLAIDKDMCPQNDSIIANAQRQGCTYYSRFELYTKRKELVFCFRSPKKLGHNCSRLAFYRPKN